MLKRQAFAHAVGILSGLIYVVFVILAKSAPAVYEYVFNAQFLGAHLAPSGVEFNLGVLITVVLFGWIAGYILAWLYNQFA